MPDAKPVDPLRELTEIATRCNATPPCSKRGEPPFQDWPYCDRCLMVRCELERWLAAHDAQQQVCKSCVDKLPFDTAKYADGLKRHLAPEGYVILCGVSDEQRRWMALGAERIIEKLRKSKVVVGMECGPEPRLPTEFVRSEEIIRIIYDATLPDSGEQAQLQEAKTAADAVIDVLDKHCRGSNYETTSYKNVAAVVNKVCELDMEKTLKLQALAQHDAQIDAKWIAQIDSQDRRMAQLRDEVRAALEDCITWIDFEPVGMPAANHTRTELLKRARAALASPERGTK